MTLHVFADAGLMLGETAGTDASALHGVHCTSYRQHRLPGPSARLWQLLHLVARPLHLGLSAWAVGRFNRRLAVDPAQLEAGLQRIADGDHVLWINPSLALAPLIPALMQRRLRLFIYFLDPVHRLGLDAATVRAWSRSHWVGSYWPEEAARLGLTFLAPYAPTLPPAPSERRDFDIVYVGSPSPKRLLWTLALGLHLKLRGGRGHLRLASRTTWLARSLPRLFSPRVPYADYAALCRRSRGVLELHERDAGGVTLRATLCEAIGAVHLCNQPSTPDTVRLSWWRWSAFDRFVRARHAPVPAAFAPPRLGARPLSQWLQDHFG